MNMEQSISITDSKYQFEKYFDEYNISEITKEKLGYADILVLPSPYKNEKYYFAQESVNFTKYCQTLHNDLKMDILADDDKIEVRSLHSFDIWMPIIWVASTVVLPIVTGLVTNYIYDRIKGREHEECTVKVTFIVKEGDKIKELHYDGDPKAFKDTFEKIDIHKL